MAQLVRGELEPLSPPPPEEAASPDSSSASKETNHDDSDGNHGNAGHPKKPAWSRPLNGVVSVSGPPVMGDAVAWPALSEATKAPSKSTPDFLSPSESAPAPQTKTDSVNSTQNQKKHANANTNSNPNSTTNPKSPRQRSSKRGGGTRAGPVQNGFIRAPPPPPPLPSLPLPPPPPVFPLFEMPYGALAPVPDYFPYNGSNWEGVPMGGFVPPSNSAGYQSSPRNSSRRGNFGGHHNGRNASRSPNMRDVRVPQQIAPPRGFLRPAPPPPGSIPFLRPHSVGPFGYPMGFDMPFPFVYVPTPPLESFNEVPFTAQASPMPPLPSAVLDDAMRASLVSQIDYYFCDDNLSRDDFLRSKMDDEGWVPISLIAGFPKVQQWTNDVGLIFDSLKASSVVEVQPYKVRRRDEWKKWVCTPNRFATGSGFQSTGGSTENTITSSLIKVTLDEAAANESSIMSEADSSAKVVPCTIKSEELTSHSNLANGETMVEESCSSHI